MNKTLANVLGVAMLVMVTVYIGSELRSLRERKSLYRSIDTLEKRVWEEQE